MKDLYVWTLQLESNVLFIKSQANIEVLGLKVDMDSCLSLACYP